MLHHDGLLHDAKDVARLDRVAHLHAGLELPLLRVVDGGHADPAGDVGALCRLLDQLQRTLDPIVELLDDPRPQLDAQGLAKTDDGLSRLQAGRFLIDLDGRLVPIHVHDLSDQARRADVDHVGHAGAQHSPGDYQGAGDTLYRSLNCIFVRHSYRLRLYFFM